MLGKEKPSSTAFPYKIGCGLAGGKWSKYEAMIEAFAEANPDVEVTIVWWDRFADTKKSSHPGVREFHGKFLEQLVQLRVLYNVSKQVSAPLDPNLVARDL